MQAYLYGQENDANTTAFKCESPFSPTPLLFINKTSEVVKPRAWKLRILQRKQGTEEGRAIYSVSVA